MILLLGCSGHIASELGQRGAESARPYLQRLYRTRMTAYRDAIKEFSQGFGEGLAQDEPKGEAGRDKADGGGGGQ